MLNRSFGEVRLETSCQRALMPAASAAKALNPTLTIAWTSGPSNNRSLCLKIGCYLLSTTFQIFYHSGMTSAKIHWYFPATGCVPDCVDPVHSISPHERSDCVFYTGGWLRCSPWHRNQFPNQGESKKDEAAGIF